LLNYEKEGRKKGEIEGKERKDNSYVDVLTAESL